VETRKVEITKVEKRDRMESRRLRRLYRVMIET